MTAFGCSIPSFRPGGQRTAKRQSVRLKLGGGASTSVPLSLVSMSMPGRVDRSATSLKVATVG
jgi:hypothetical protein